MNNLNYSLIDKFRQMGRLMRIGRSPGELVAGEEGADAKESCSCSVNQRDIILGVLLMNGGGLRQKEVAEEIQVSPSTLSEMIRKLEEEGYLVRRPDPDDRRAAILNLTEDGEARAGIMREAYDRMLQYLFRNMSDQDKQEMIRLFDLILEDHATC